MNTAPCGASIEELNAALMGAEELNAALPMGAEEFNAAPTGAEELNVKSEIFALSKLLPRYFLEKVETDDDEDVEEDDESDVG